MQIMNRQGVVINKPTSQFAAKRVVNGEIVDAVTSYADYDCTTEFPTLVCYVGDTLTEDGYHMNELGRVITSYTWLATFLNEPLTEINITNVTDTLILTEQDKAMILESVNNAIKNPFAVTQSQYTTAS